ncbi:MAG: hypothetical protein AAGA85_12125 [Bacteroidota bacterium]
MMIKNLPLLLFIIIVIGSCSDAEDLGPGDTFLKYYGEAGIQGGEEILYLSESGESILYGVQISAEEAQSDLYLLKVDANGNEIASETYDLTDTATFGSEARFNDIAGSLRREGSQLYFIGSSQNANFSSLTWAIFDLDFGLEQQGWISIDGVSLAGKDLFADNEELVLVGTADAVLQPGDPLSSNSADEQQIYLARINPADPDSILVQRTRGFEGRDDVLYVDRFADDNIVIIGTTQRTSSRGTNILVMALNDIFSPRGNEEISIVIGGEDNYNEEVFDVYKRDDGYVITGSSSRGPSAFPFFVNISYNASGTITIDQRDTLGVSASTGNNGVGRGITFGPNGNYFIVGVMPTLDKGSEIMLLQTDQSGNHLEAFERGYGLTAGNDTGNDIVVTTDGSLLILSTVDLGQGNNLLSLMKVNTKGDLMR